MMSVLFPKAIGDAEFISSGVAEPDSGVGEVAWVSAGTYAAGDRRTRATTHKVYECIIAVSGSTVPPEDDAINWEADGPTNKWAWNDLYTDTVTTTDTPLTFTVSPGTVTAAVFYGLVGETLRLQVKDEPGGTTYFDETYSLDEYDGPDLMWEFYFGEQRQLTEFLITGIYPEPLCQITVTIAAATGDVGCGRASFGNLESLGMAEYGFTAKPRSFAKIKTDEFANVTIKPGRSAVDIAGSAVMGLQAANAAASTIKRLLGIPVALIPDPNTSYDWLKGYGLVEAEIRAEGPSHVRLNVKLEGIS
jgi:hypothetical protein